MKYCTNCGEQIKGDNKFCTNCGTPVQVVEKEWNTNMETEAKKTKYLSKKMIMIGGLITIIAIIFIGKNIFSDTNSSEPLFDIDEEVGKIEGDWYDPSGVILNDKTAIINFESVGSFAEGQDRNNIIKISMIPTNKNTYFAKVNLDGSEAEFDVTYYNEENKLVFFSTLTKTSWSIKKIKN